MSWQVHAIGTRAALNTELASLPTAPATAIDQDLRAAVINLVEKCWDPTQQTVANTVLNGTLELTMHGNSDEKGFSVTVRVGVVKAVAHEVSTATIPNVTLNGATTFTP